MLDRQEKSVAQPQVSPELPALDVEFLNEATFGDAALQDEVIALLVLQVESFTAQLALQMDSKNWAYLCHTLRGAAGAIGAAQLSSIAEAWQNTGCPRGTAQRDAAALELAAALTAFKRAVALLNR